MSPNKGLRPAAVSESHLHPHLKMLPVLRPCTKPWPLLQAMQGRLPICHEGDRVHTLGEGALAGLLRPRGHTLSGEDSQGLLCPRIPTLPARAEHPVHQRTHSVHRCLELQHTRALHQPIVIHLNAALWDTCDMGAVRCNAGKCAHRGRPASHNLSCDCKQSKHSCDRSDFSLKSF